MRSFAAHRYLLRKTFGFLKKKEVAETKKNKLLLTILTASIYSLWLRCFWFFFFTKKNKF